MNGPLYGTTLTALAWLLLQFGELFCRERCRVQ